MPEQDALFAQILARVPGARLHLIPHPDEGVRRWLLKRMEPQLARHGISPDRVIMHGYRPLAGFLALADRCAVNLDAVGWSGGMSAIDLLGRGIPTVTIAGHTMRSRQTACLLHHAGLPELVADDGDGYVDMAVALATDPALRERIDRHLRLNGPDRHDRQAVIDALANFLKTCEPARADAGHSVPT